MGARTANLIFGLEDKAAKAFPGPDAADASGDSLLALSWGQRMISALRTSRPGGRHAPSCAHGQRAEVFSHFLSFRMAILI